MRVLIVIVGSRAGVDAPGLWPQDEVDEVGRARELERAGEDEEA